MEEINMDFCVSSACECNHYWMTEKIVATKNYSQVTIFGLFHGHETITPATQARRLFRKYLEQHVGLWMDEEQEVINALKDVFEKTQYEMWKEQNTANEKLNIRNSASGTSACIVVIKRNKLFVAHVGSSGVTIGIEDSISKNWMARQLTEEHTLRNDEEVERIKISQQKVVYLKNDAYIARQPTQSNLTPYLCTKGLGNFWSFNHISNSIVVQFEPTCSVVQFNESTKCIIIGTYEFNNSVTRQDLVTHVQEANYFNGLLKSDGVVHENLINPSQYLISTAIENRKCSLLDRHLMAMTITFSKSNLDKDVEIIGHSEKSQCINAQKATNLPKFKNMYCRKYDDSIKNLLSKSKKNLSTLDVIVKDNDSNYIRIPSSTANKNHTVLPIVSVLNRYLSESKKNFPSNNVPKKYVPNILQHKRNNNFQKKNHNTVSINSDVNLQSLSEINTVLDHTYNKPLNKKHKVDNKQRESKNKIVQLNSQINKQERHNLESEECVKKTNIPVAVTQFQEESINKIKFNGIKENDTQQSLTEENTIQCDTINSTITETNIPIAITQFEAEFINKNKFNVIKKDNSEKSSIEEETINIDCTLCIGDNLKITDTPKLASVVVEPIESTYTELFQEIEDFILLTTNTNYPQNKFDCDLIDQVEVAPNLEENVMNPTTKDKKRKDEEFLMFWDDFDSILANENKYNV